MIAFARVSPRDMAIFREYQDGASQRAIAERFNLSQQSIHGIVAQTALRLGEPRRSGVARPVSPRALEIFRKYQAGTSRSQILREYRIGRPRLEEILHRVSQETGETIRSPHASSRRTIPAELLELFRMGDITVEDVAVRLGVSNPTARRALRASGVDLAATCQARLTRLVQARPTTCRHCGGRVTRSRGLCWSCYEDKTIRQQYPPLEVPVNSRGSHADFNAATKLPEPTTALPGTKEKIAVLQERVRLGLATHHPLDARRSLS